MEILVGFLHSSVGKESACSSGDPGSIPGSGRSPEKEMAIQSSTLAWKNPWTEEPGGLQSMACKELDNLATKPPPLPMKTFKKGWKYPRYFYGLEST